MCWGQLKCVCVCVLYFVCVCGVVLCAFCVCVCVCVCMCEWVHHLSHHTEHTWLSSDKTSSQWCGYSLAPPAGQWSDWIRNLQELRIGKVPWLGIEWGRLADLLYSLLHSSASASCAEPSPSVKYDGYCCDDMRTNLSLAVTDGNTCGWWKISGSLLTLCLSPSSCSSLVMSNAPLWS